MSKSDPPVGLLRMNFKVYIVIYYFNRIK